MCLPPSLYELGKAYHILELGIPKESLLALGLATLDAIALAFGL